MPNIQQGLGAGNADARIGRQTSSHERDDTSHAEMTVSSPPPSGPRRWVPQRKAEVVAAVRSGDISLDEARKRLDEYVARGDKQLKDKIAQAEAQAVAEVRAAAADSAAKVAESILRGGVAGGKDFVAEGIRQLGALAH